MAEAAKKIPRYYWDSCVFLSFIEGDAQRAPVIESLLDDCDNKRIEIWSSHFSIVEVAFAKTEKDGRLLDAAIEAEIDNLWQPESPIKLVEVSQLACTDARSLLRAAVQATITLKGADAVHLATAKMIGGIDKFHTYDERLWNCHSLVPFPICEPIAEQLFLTGLTAPPQTNEPRQEKSDSQ